MERIVIIGSSGAGKTTLSKKLGNILNINVYHLDRIFWGRGWKRIAREDRIDILQDIVQRKQWIIEGTYLKSSEPRLKAADTIIFLDIRADICCKRVVERHYQNNDKPRRDLPIDSSDRFSLLHLLWVFFFPLMERITMKEKISIYKDKRIIILRSTKQVDSLVALLQQSKSDSIEKIPNLEPMNKIAIIGPSGSRKTMLAEKLSAILKIDVLKTNVYHLDRIFWGRGWKRIAREDRIDIAQDIVQRKRWIIEGNYPDSSEPCLYAADTIIFLDVSLLLCLRRLVKRQYKEFGLRRRDLPMDCTDRLTLQLIIKVLFFKITKRGPLLQELKIYEDEGKEIIIFQSTQQVNEFVAQQQALMSEEILSHSETVRQLILT